MGPLVWGKLEWIRKDSFYLFIKERIFFGNIYFPNYSLRMRVWLPFLCFKNNRSFTYVSIYIVWIEQKSFQLVILWEKHSKVQSFTLIRYQINDSTTSLACVVHTNVPLYSTGCFIFHCSAFFKFVFRMCRLKIPRRVFLEIELIIE